MPRIKIVPVKRAHAAEMFPILTDRELYSFTGGDAPLDREDVDRWFAALESRLSPDGSERWLTWIVQLIECSTSIGYVQATVKNGEADIAWLIGVEWQGQGYATEAVRSLGHWLSENHINSITARIHPDHTASQRLARHLNMRNTGLFREGEEIWCSQNPTV